MGNIASTDIAGELEPVRQRTPANQDSAARVGTAVPWIVASVEALPHYRLKVRFANGTEGVVDASRLVLGPNPGVFMALRDPREFARAYVERGVVTWPGELDLAPDAMYDEIRANGEWVIPAY